MRLRKQSSGRSILAGVVLLATAGSGLPAAAASVPFVLNLSGSASLPASGGIQTGASTGTISPFGQATAALVFSGSSSVTVMGTFTLSNGTFSGTFSGPAPGVFRIHDNVVFTFSGDISGGTGAFKGATGTLQGAVTVFDINPSAPSNYTFTGSGTVNTVDLGPGGLTLTPGGLTFAVAEGAGGAASQGVVLNNSGGTPVSFTATPKTTSGGNWLSVSQTSGSVAPLGNLPLTVTVNAAGLKAGIYLGQVMVTFATGSLTAFVELVVGPAGAYLQLSQTGLLFTGNSLGSSLPPQTIVATNTGAGTLAGLNVTATVLDGQGWLTATVVSSTPTQVKVSIAASPARLADGLHHGHIVFSLPGAPNSPQTASVVLKVVSNNIGYYMGPSTAGIVKGLSDDLPHFGIVSNFGNVPTSVSLNIVYTLGRGEWLSVSDIGGDLPAGSPPRAFNLTIKNTDGFPVGLYAAEVHAHWTPDPLGRGDSIMQVLYVVPSRDPVQLLIGPNPANCVPTQLEAVFSIFQKDFEATAGLPVPIHGFVFDNCGQFMNTGSVVAAFSSGDSAVPLTPTGNGEWSATWVPHKAAAGVTITLQAQTLTAPILSATRSLTGSVAENTTTPLIGGVGSAASGAPIIAPGEFIAIYGSNLAAGTTVTQSVPFGTSLGGTQVWLGGRSLPLYFTASGQIDAIVPYDVPVNSIQQLIVQTGTAYSQPEPVTIGAAHAGVFTQNQSGTGPGAILGQKPGGVPSLNTASNPASAGDALLIFCTGLGTISPSVPAGSPAPFALFNTDNPVTVKVGGQPAPMLFAGLAPGYVGLYQVNVIVPPGIAPSSSVPVVLTAAGADSVPVTVAIK